MASSISASVGLAVFASSDAAAINLPDWHEPHCGTSSSIHACCTGCEVSSERPSIEVTVFPATLASGVTQERTAFPLTWTVHAPHSAMPMQTFTHDRLDEER